jgi:hypothetical protein
MGPPAMPEDDHVISLEVIALDVVRTVRSELRDVPTVTLASWDVGDAVVILLRYRTVRSRAARTARLAERHHVELTEAIGARIGLLASGRLELLGSSFSPHRCLSALAFGAPDDLQACPLSPAPDAHPSGALPAAD